jgi:hypothetical protein
MLSRSACADLSDSTTAGPIGVLHCGSDRGSDPNGLRGEGTTYNPDKSRGAVDTDLLMKFDPVAPTDPDPSPYSGF